MNILRTLFSCGCLDGSSDKNEKKSMVFSIKMINIFKILTRYFDELLNDDEKKLLLQTSKLCESIEFTCLEIDNGKLRSFNIKNFYGSISMLEFATDKRNKNRYVMDVEKYKYIKTNNKDIFAEAAENGNLENMKRLKQIGYPCDEYTFEKAAINGNLKNMKWLKENECPWNANVFLNTALKGNLENMKWLKKIDVQ